MNRNDEKLGVQPPSQRELFELEMKGAKQAKVEAEKPKMPDIGLSFVNPTKYVTLPSAGDRYPENHPLYQKKIIEIKLMTTHEENILTNKALERHGETVNKLLRSIIVDKSIDPETVLSVDRNAIIVSSRMYGYGNDYPTSVHCPLCGKVLKQSVNIPKAIEKSLEKIDQIPEAEKDFGVRWTGERTFSIPLKQTGWIVECKLTNGKDEKIQFEKEKSMEKLKHEQPNHPLVANEMMMSDFLDSIIVSIDGNDGVGPRKDRGQIKGAIETMPAIDSKIIKDVYKVMSPRIALLQDLYCENCRYEGVIEVPIGPDFFPVV